MSPSDRLATAQKKMRLWAANGVDLGWLIDDDAEGPVEGFLLLLGEISAGLQPRESAIFDHSLKPVHND
jgi:Uma2 family endonuclease